MKSGEGLRELLTIPGEASETGDPRKGAFHGPALGQQYKPAYGLLEYDHHQLDALGLGGLRRLFSGIAFLDRQKPPRRGLRLPLEPCPPDPLLERAPAHQPTSLSEQADVPACSQRHELWSPSFACSRYNRPGGRFQESPAGCARKRWQRSDGGLACLGQQLAQVVSHRFKNVAQRMCPLVCVYPHQRQIRDTECPLLVGNITGTDGFTRAPLVGFVRHPKLAAWMSLQCTSFSSLKCMTPFNTLGTCIQLSSVPANSLIYSLKDIVSSSG